MLGLIKYNFVVVSNILAFPFALVFSKPFPWDFIDCSSKVIVFIMPYFSFVWRGDSEIFYKLLDDETLDAMMSAPPESISKSSCDVNNKLIHEEKSSARCATVLINCCNPYWEVIASILQRSYDVFWSCWCNEIAVCCLKLFQESGIWSLLYRFPWKMESDFIRFTL